jgi:hypothetical protein
MERPFHCTDMDTRSIKQVEDICGQQSCRHPRRNHLLQPGDMCHLNPILLL